MVVIQSRFDTLPAREQWGEQHPPRTPGRAADIASVVEVERELKQRRDQSKTAVFALLKAKFEMEATMAAGAL